MPFFSWSGFVEARPELMGYIPQHGEILLLEPIGNHSRGTMFLNGNEHISEALCHHFDEIARNFTGIYYGRFDLKCHSISELEKGERYKVLEFNGVASEPAHIYDPSYPTWKAYRDIFRHWKIIYQISRVQLTKGVKPMTIREAARSLREYIRYMKEAGNTESS